LTKNTIDYSLQASLNYLQIISEPRQTNFNEVPKICDKVIKSVEAKIPD